MLSKGQLVERLVERGAGDKKHVSNMLSHLTAVAVEEVEAGQDFVVPGIAKIEFQYRAPQKKGSRWSKGDTRVNNITKEETIADADSPPVTRRARMRAVPTGLVARHKPKTAPEAQKEFFASKAGKALLRRKG